jgi:hypothetical protein
MFFNHFHTRESNMSKDEREAASISTCSHLTNDLSQPDPDNIHNWRHSEFLGKEKWHSDFVSQQFSQPHAEQFIVLMENHTAGLSEGVLKYA